MKQITNTITVLAVLLFISLTSTAQKTTENNSSKTTNTTAMKMYVIEREIPNVGKSTPEELKVASQKSNGVLSEMGPKIEWVQSYVTGNKLFCVYKAENEELIKEHAKKSGFPASKITEVSTIINPATGNN